jgi:hypothetical protein
MLSFTADFQELEGPEIGSPPISSGWPIRVLAERRDVLQDEATEAESQSGLPMFETNFSGWDQNFPRRHRNMKRYSSRPIEDIPIERGEFLFEPADKGLDLRTLISPPGIHQVVSSA